MGLISVTGARIYAGRDNAANPRSPCCQLHLRVVCGVCEDFEGDLRGEGRCRRLGIRLRGGRPAEDCEFWTRRRART